jgi:hypothetical protein
MDARRSGLTPSTLGAFNQDIYSNQKVAMRNGRLSA